MKSKTINIHHKLVEACKNNNRQAQNKVYELYYKAMYNTAYRILPNSLEAEDVMQEAFISAFKNIDTYREEVSFGAWLKKIVINKSLDVLKKKDIDTINVDDYDKNLPEVNSDISITNLEDDVKEIKKALYNLAPGYRVILSLYLFEGYDHEEIAQIQNISASTSRSQYTRAKKKLLEELNKQPNKFNTLRTQSNG